MSFKNLWKKIRGTSIIMLIVPNIYWVSTIVLLLILLGEDFIVPALEYFIDCIICDSSIDTIIYSILGLIIGLPLMTLICGFIYWAFAWWTSYLFLYFVIPVSLPFLMLFIAHSIIHGDTPLIILMCIWGILGTVVSIINLISANKLRLGKMQTYESWETGTYYETTYTVQGDEVVGKTEEKTEYADNGSYYWNSFLLLVRYLYIAFLGVFIYFKKIKKAKKEE